MAQQSQSRTSEVNQKIATIKSVLQSQANKHGEIPEDAYVEITVSYETRQGNTSEKSGETWRVSEDKINFSQNIGDDEDAYYIVFKYSGPALVSVSDMGSETELGKITDIQIN
jgi:hypothetical protein